MGFSQHIVVFHVKHPILLTSLLFLLASLTFLQHPIFVQGLPFPHHNDQVKGQEEKLIERALIGSSPPRCAGRCNNCGHCEAIQVPVVPQPGFPRSHFLHSNPTIAYSRGDGLSNYKPMSWKCKCGSSIFNP